MDSVEICNSADVLTIGNKPCSTLANAVPAPVIWPIRGECKTLYSIFRAIRRATERNIIASAFFELAPSCSLERTFRETFKAIALNT